MNCDQEKMIKEFTSTGSIVGTTKTPNKACTPSLRFGRWDSPPPTASIFPWTARQGRLASSFLCSQALSTPAHLPVTQTVRLRRKHGVKSLQPLIQRKEFRKCRSVNLETAIWKSRP